MEMPLTLLLKEFPSLPANLDTLAVRLARGKHDTGAELYVHETGRRTAVLALGAQAFEHQDRLVDFLRHEFMHLRDMLHPDFAYAPALTLPGFNPAQQRLARERYRLLWDITIDGRLAAAGHTPSATREQHLAAFSRAFSFWPVSRQNDTFDSLWINPDPRHAQFLAIIADPRGLRQTHGPAPGASCPLCDFPTFHWADPALLTAPILHRITTEFPPWSPADGVCGRCLETYQARPPGSAPSPSAPLHFSLCTPHSALP
jgi:hypothetical protein